MTEKKKVDLGEGIEQAAKTATRTVNDSVEDLQKELEKADPLLGMLTHQIFAQGDMIGQLADELKILKEKNRVVEKHLGFLIEKDPLFQAHFTGPTTNDKPR